MFSTMILVLTHFNIYSYILFIFFLSFGLFISLLMSHFSFCISQLFSCLLADHLNHQVFYALAFLCVVLHNDWYFSLKERWRKEKWEKIEWLFYFHELAMRRDENLGGVDWLHMVLCQRIQWIAQIKFLKIMFLNRIWRIYKKYVLKMTAIY